MELTLVSQLEEEWPPLAWLASFRPGEAEVRVRHGRQVEVRSDWFCEAVWDGDFSAGDFDTTDLVFGSGGRLRNGELVFVTSCATVDRLQYRQLGGTLFVSNSLCCLLSCTDAQLELSFERYPAFFRSIEKGIDDYEDRLPLIDGDVRLLYFRNMTWNGSQLTRLDKVDPPRNFSSFQRYRDFLSSALSRIACNMTDHSRKHRYEFVGALSSGYDSTTVTVLAREAGLRRVFSFQNARGGGIDSGERTAKLLGLEVVLAERQAWRRGPLPEIPYFAATGVGPDVIFSGVSDLLQGKALITGFQGGRIWRKHITALGRNVVRGDASGLSFSEHRLSLGTIHVPVAFMGVRDVAQIHSITNSQEMRPWDVLGEYTKPICRRIVEEAGVPREWFGQTKMAATSLFHWGESRLNPETEKEYHQWLADLHRSRSGTFAAVTKPPARPLIFLRDHYYRVQRTIGALQRIAGRTLSDRLASVDVNWERAINLLLNPLNMLFPFAVEKMRLIYGTKGSQAAGVPGSSEATRH